jgi:methionyl-tRNA synthetase
LCLIHKTKPDWIKEKNYFFRLSSYRDRVLAHYAAHPAFVEPESRRNEMLRLLDAGLEDISVSRAGQSWGIPLPFDPTSVVYVWYDALINYAAAVGYGCDKAAFDTWWPADLHIVGKDITRFHCVVWPAMLMSAGVEPPRQVFGHGWVLFKGEKMSKSLGTVVDPLEAAERLGPDPLRWYLTREIAFGQDGDFSWELFEKSYNADLANNLGNLYSRVVTLITKNYDGVLGGTAGRAPRPVVGMELSATVEQVRQHVEACRYNQALELVWRQVLDPANQYAEQQAPWKLVKTDKDAAKEVLFTLLDPLRAATVLLKPFLPRSAETIYTSFNFVRPWTEVQYEDAAKPQTATGDLRVLASLVDGKVKPLFPRIG